jgi:hypothetical protein
VVQSWEGPHHTDTDGASRHPTRIGGDLMIEDPAQLLGRLRLGREEYCQRLLTMLMVAGPYPKPAAQRTDGAGSAAVLGKLVRPNPGWFVSIL